MLSSIKLNIVSSYTKTNLRLVLYILVFYIFLFILIFNFSFGLGVFCTVLSLWFVPHSIIAIHSVLSQVYCDNINTVYYDYTSINEMSTSYSINQKHLISTFTLFARLIATTKIKKLPYPFDLFCKYREEYPKEFKEFCIRNAEVEIDLSNITEQASNDVREYYKAICIQLYPDYNIEEKLYPNRLGY